MKYVRGGKVNPFTVRTFTTPLSLKQHSTFSAFVPYNFVRSAENTRQE